MTWQIAYAIKNIVESRAVIAAQPLRGDAIQIAVRDRPDIISVVSAAHTINADVASAYHREFPNMDFLCGFRSECVWEGGAIDYVEGSGVGWGSLGTLGSAILDDNVQSAAHKTYFFANRLIRQLREVRGVRREYDRILRITLLSGQDVRLGLVASYEPTADSIRSMWERFGPINVAWNINPNGDPTLSAIEAGRQLGCEVMKWDELKAYLRRM